MNGYEKIIKTIRDEAGKSAQPPALKLATMASATSCSLGAMELDKDDLYIASHLAHGLKAGDLVLVSRVSAERYAIIEKIEEVV